MKKKRRVFSNREKKNPGEPIKDNFDFREKDRFQEARSLSYVNVQLGEKRLFIEWVCDAR